MVNKKKRISGSAGQVAIAERELAKGNTKQALKEVRVCFRRDPSDATRQLLQRALIKRSMELHSRGMFPEALAHLRELSDLGDLTEDQQHDVARLQFLLGAPAATAQTGSNHFAPDAQLRNVLADQLVVRGPESGGSSDSKQMARAVRDALQAVESADAARAQELLAPIGRESPFMEWKLFVRGLLGFYDGDEDRMQANWSRLSEGRAPRTIADTIRVAFCQARRAEVSAAVVQNAAQLHNTCEPPTLAALRNLATRFADPNWRALHAEFQSFARQHAETEPELVSRVRTILIEDVIDARGFEELAAIKRSFPAPPLDPHWHRATALVEDRIGEPHKCEKAWLSYIQDLEQNPQLRPEQRQLAQAIVYRDMASKLARLVTSEAAQAIIAMGIRPKAVYRHADRYFDLSRSLDPQGADTFLQQADFLVDCDQIKRAGKIYQEFLQNFPEDFEGAMLAADFFLHRIADAKLAEQAACQALRLRPRDEKARQIAWDSRRELARQSIIAGDFAAADKWLVEAQSVVGPDRPESQLAAIRAAAAWRGGDPHQAEVHVKAAETQFDQTSAGLLSVYVETNLCAVADDFRNATCTRWETSLQQNKSARCAGAMATLLYGLHRARGQRPFQPACELCLCDYISRCTRLRWHEDDLVRVCRFLGLFRDQQKLLKKMAGIGLKRFPKNPYFHYFVGQAELSGYRFLWSRVRIKDHFIRALELSKDGVWALDEDSRNLATQAIMGLESGHWDQDMFYQDGENEYEDKCDDDDDDHDDGDGFDLDSMSLDRVNGDSSDESEENPFDALMWDDEAALKVLGPMMPPDLRLAVMRNKSLAKKVLSELRKMIRKDFEKSGDCADDR